jgi:hypothetical protein
MRLFWSGTSQVFDLGDQGTRHVERGAVDLVGRHRRPGPDGRPRPGGAGGACQPCSLAAGPASRRCHRGGPPAAFRPGWQAGPTVGLVPASRHCRRDCDRAARRRAWRRIRPARRAWPRSGALPRGPALAHARSRRRRAAGAASRHASSRDPPDRHDSGRASCRGQRDDRRRVRLHFPVRLRQLSEARASSTISTGACAGSGMFPRNGISLIARGTYEGFCFSTRNVVSRHSGNSISCKYSEVLWQGRWCLLLQS